jgi:hypothetical protein
MTLRWRHLVRKTNGNPWKTTTNQEEEDEEEEEKEGGEQ